MKTVVSTLLLVIMGSACSRTRDLNNDNAINKEDNITIQQCSIIELIANGQRYDSNKIYVSGYLELEYEGSALYLDRESCNNKITKNGISLDIPAQITNQAINHRYCSVMGYYNSAQKGHGGLFSGMITGIWAIASIDGNVEIDIETGLVKAIEYGEGIGVQGF